MAKIVPPNTGNLIIKKAIQSSTPAASVQGNASSSVASANNGDPKSAFEGVLQGVVAGAKANSGAQLEEDSTEEVEDDDSVE